MTDAPASRRPKVRDGVAVLPVSVLTAPVDDPAVSLSPELVDLITEAVAMPATAAARAEVVGTMLLRAVDAVVWRSGAGGGSAEAASLLRVVKAASAHRNRMVSAIRPG